MNGHQNVAFSHLIGALKSPRNLNGYRADYVPFTIRYVHEDLNDPVYEYHGVRLWLKEKEEYWHLYIAKNINGLFLFQ